MRLVEKTTVSGIERERERERERDRRERSCALLQLSHIYHTGKKANISSTC